MKAKSQRSKLQKLMFGLLAAIHKPWAEVWLWYRQMMQAGWYEAIDARPVNPQEGAGCPVVGLIEKSNLIQRKERSI